MTLPPVKSKIVATVGPSSESAGELALLTEGPSPRNPEANLRLEIIELS